MTQTCGGRLGAGEVPSSQRVYPALLAEEIFIVQMHGRDDEAKRLEDILEAADGDGQVGAAFPDISHACIVEILTMAEAIRDRQKLGMHWTCCWRCQSYSACKERLARYDASVRCNCCKKCVHFEECREKCTE